MICPRSLRSKWLGFLGDDQLVADGQVVLQGLAEVGDLARTLIQNDGLVEEVLFQMLADEIHFRPQQFEQLQAVFRRGDQLVQFHQAVIELARRFAQVGLGQVAQPALQVARRCLAEGQTVLIGRGDAQLLMWTRFFPCRSSAPRRWLNACLFRQL